MTVRGGLTLTDDGRLIAGGSEYGPHVTLYGGQHIAGTGAVILTGTLRVSDETIIDPGVTIMTGPAVGGAGEIAQGRVRNRGTIWSRVPGQMLNLNPASLVDGGVMRVSPDAIVGLGGTFNLIGGTINGGVVETSGGDVRTRGGAALLLGDNVVLSNVAAVDGELRVLPRHGGAWDGPGIVTSMPDARSGLTTLAVATAGQVGRTSFGGLSVSANDVLARPAVRPASPGAAKSSFSFLCVAAAIKVPAHVGGTVNRT